MMNELNTALFLGSIILAFTLGLAFIIVIEIIYRMRGVSQNV